eukprot:5091339-Pyramimonas_sp.AAC.1
MLSSSGLESGTGMWCGRKLAIQLRRARCCAASSANNAVWLRVSSPFLVALVRRRSTPVLSHVCSHAAAATRRRCVSAAHKGANRSVPSSAFKCAVHHWIQSSRLPTRPSRCSMSGNQ